MAFERNFNASQLRGSVSGTIVVVGPLAQWTGTLHGAMTPEGASGRLIMREETFAGTPVSIGRRFVASWAYTGHPDHSRPHSLAIHVDGQLLG